MPIVLQTRFSILCGKKIRGAWSLYLHFYWSKLLPEGPRTKFNKGSKKDKSTCHKTQDKHQRLCNQGTHLCGILNKFGGNVLINSQAEVLFPPGILCKEEFPVLI